MKKKHCLPSDVVVFLSSYVGFLPVDNFIGTLELLNGETVASPIKARVDHGSTSVLTADQHEQH